MTIRITVQDCHAIYSAEINAGPLLRPDALDAAVAAPFQTFGGVDLLPTLAEKGAKLAFGIAESQAYRDGNKRLAWLTLVVFLELNGTSIEIDQDEAAHAIRALGDPDSRLTFDAFTQWLIKCLA